MNEAGNAWRPVTVWLIRELLQNIWGLKVTGLEHVPRSGPALLACNHASFLDPPLLACAIDEVRRPYYLGKKEVFENPLWAWLFRSTGVIPLDRARADHAAMRAALDVLETGGMLTIFPEGTRVKPGETRAPKAGVGFLAARAKAPVLPARVLGTRWPWSFPIEVRFGPPLPPPADDSREAAHDFAVQVMRTIYSL